MIPLFAVAVLIAIIGYFLLRARFHGQASLHYNAGEFDAAMGLYNRIIRFYPRDAAAYRNRALVHMQRDNYPAAVSDFDKAIEYNPREVGLRLERATLYTQLKQYDAAQEAYANMVNLSPENPQVYLNRAWFRIKTGDYAGAIADTETAQQHIRAMQDKSDKFGAYMNDGVSLNQMLSHQAIHAISLTGAAYTRMGQHDDAITAYEQAIAEDPEDPMLRNDKAEAHFNAGDYSIALAVFQQAYDLMEQHADQYPAQTLSGQTMREFITAGLAISHYKLGQFDDALPLWTQLMEKNDKYADPDWVENELNWTPHLAQASAELTEQIAVRSA